MKKSTRVILFCISILLLLIISSGTRGYCAFVDEKINQLVNEGDKLIKGKEYKEALLKYQEAVKLNDENPIPHYKVGVASYFLKDYDQAIESYKKAIRLEPEFVKALNNLALIYDKQGEDTQAMMLYKKALELKPGYEKARYNLGALLIRMEKLDEARKQANKLVGNNLKYYKGYYLLGLVHEYKEEYGEAEEMYLKALSINADFMAAISGMKRIKQLLAQKSGYKKELEKAMKIVRFKVLPQYYFLNVRDVLSGAKVISLRFGEDQDILIVKFPDSHLIGDKNTVELINEDNEDFRNFLKDMKITVPKITSSGEFKETEMKSEDRDGSNKKEGDSTGKEKRGREETGKKKDETGKTDKDKKPEKKSEYKKTRQYVRIKCIYEGEDREGIMVVFKPGEEMDRMLYISFAPPDKFSMGAARVFYNHIRAPKM